jgi:CheY-like chemotaxis protein
MIKSLLQMIDGSQSLNEVKRLVKSHIPDIKHALQSVESMLDDINNFGKKVALKQDPIAPEEIILKSLNEVCPIIPREDITLSYNFQHSKLLFVDQTKAQQLFSNIILNAMQVMPKNSTLWFESKDSADGFIQFCIGNTGTFIERDDLDQVFKLFFTKNKTNGNGLGLAIAHKVVANHGGKIWCTSSKEDMKVEFFFTLPYTKFFKAKKVELPSSTTDVLNNLRQSDGAPLNVIVDPKDTEFEQKVLEKIRNLKRPLVIGIVEDEAIYINALKDLVSHSGDLKAHIAMIELKDVDATLSYITNSTPDMLICDVDLGVNSINGFELVEKLRREPYKYAKPICMHSNRCLPEDYERAIKSGAQSFLPKPMSRVHLLKFILNTVNE